MSSLSSEWTARELVHLMLLADRSSAGLRDPRALLQRLRDRLLACEGQCQELTPEWDWRPASR